MHYIRLWIYLEYLLLVGLLIFAWLDVKLYFSACFIVTALIIFGKKKRKRIMEKMEQTAEQIGLKRIGLIKTKEMLEEVWYEVHVLPPKTALTSNGAEYRIIREFMKDIPKLYEYAHTHDKDVVYYGTSHDTFTKAWIKTWNSLGVVEHVEGKNADPLLRYSSWRKTIKRFYKDKRVRKPKKNEWKTIYTKIERKVA